MAGNTMPLPRIFFPGRGKKKKATTLSPQVRSPSARSRSPKKKVKAGAGSARHTAGKVGEQGAGSTRQDAGKKQQGAGPAPYLARGAG